MESSYPEADVFPVKGAGFPSIGTEDYVAGAEIQLEKHHYYPIRQFRLGDGFDRDPYSEIASEMLTTNDSNVVVQVVFRPAPNDWTDGGWGVVSSNPSVDDIAESLKQGQVAGWRDPHVRDPSQKDKQAAKIIEQQRGKAAYNVTFESWRSLPTKGRQLLAVRASQRCSSATTMPRQSRGSTPSLWPQPHRLASLCATPTTERGRIDR